jgi:hypothetical protein
MTPAALKDLSLREIRQRGADARRLTLPFFSNPFHRSSDLPLEEWVAKCMAWSDGWLHVDAGRTESVHWLMRMRFR